MRGSAIGVAGKSLVTEELVALRYAGCHGTGRLWKAGRIFILSASGSAQELGLAHGRLLKTAIAEGCVHRLAATPLSLPDIVALPAWKRWLATLYVKSLQRRIAGNLPQTYRTELAALARGSGQDRKTVVAASLLSETLQLLAASELERSKTTARANGGCTTAIAGSEGLIHAKNQDYDAAGDWDRAPLLFICRPKGGLAHAKVTSAGLLKGNLSLNEQGIVIGGHFLFAERSGRKGLTFTAAENEVARRARTLGQAVDIIRAGPHLGSFAFVVSDANAGEAVVVECNGDGAAVRPMEGGKLGMSNVHTTELVRSDALISHGLARQPLARQRRVDTLLADVAQNDVGAMIDILADNYDPDCDAPRGVGLTIANPLTVMSAVADGRRQQLWVSEGRVPTSTGRFLGFDLVNAFEGDAPELIGTARAAVDHSLSDKAIAALNAARVAYEDNADTTEAVAILHAAIASLGPKSGLLPVLGRIALREGRDDLAREAANGALAESSMNERAALQLIRGQLADIEGKRLDALAAYAVIRNLAQENGPGLGGISSTLAREADRFSRDPFAHRHRTTVSIGFAAVGGME